MKSLILALIFFGLVVYGSYDVAPFRAARRVVRRTPKAEGAGTAPLPPELPPQAVGSRRRY